MSTGYKRERTLSQIDIFFLLNQRKILTKREFLAVLPRASYVSYYQAFYRRKLNKVFSMFYNSEWFKKRYSSGDACMREDTAERLKSFLKESASRCYENRIFDYYENNILVKNIPDKMKHEDLVELCRKCLYFKDFNTYQLEQRNSFHRVGVISIDGNCDEALKFMESIVDKNSRISFEISKLSEVKVRKCGIKGINNLEDARRIFFWFCKKCEKSVKFMDVIGDEGYTSFFEREAEKSEDPFNFYVLALRKVFLFCFYCYKQYDTIYDLRISCGDWHISTDEDSASEDLSRVLIRKREIHFECNSFDFLKTRSESSELDGFVLRKDSDRFKCDCCIKIFSSAEYAKNHIKNKHPEIIEKIRTKINEFNWFVDNMDFFMISCLSGIDDNHLPSFLSLDEKVEGVRYLDKVFSGEIVINRDFDFWKA